MVLFEGALRLKLRVPMLTENSTGELLSRNHKKDSRAVFAREALADFRTVASIAPSSRYLTRAMLHPLPLAQCRLVVELGCGTGVFTQELLKRLPSTATLLAFEINPRFAHYLRSVVSDPRLVLINASADTARHEVRRLGFERVDAVVSSLGLAFIPDQERHACLGALAGLLTKNGVFTQYHYLHGLQFQNGRLARSNITSLLHRYFSSVQRTIVWRNLPPAFVFVCRGPSRTKAS